MKLIRFGEKDAEKPGILIDNQRYDCSQYFTDWNREFFHNDGLVLLDELLKKNVLFSPVPPSMRWANCVARPGKIIGIGLNYRDHAAETNSPLPQEPILFFKASNCVSGPYDDLIIPKNSKKTDWEIELGIIIKNDARYLKSVQEAKKYIAGYTIGHDVSEREFQLEHGGQWSKGKSCDTFNPLGPYLLTANENFDAKNLSLELKVNGTTRQLSNTREMIFDGDYLVYYLSQFMTIEAGDVILTGTPSGVGMGLRPPTFLKAGDIVELFIQGLGSQRQICVDYAEFK